MSSGDFVTQPLTVVGTAPSTTTNSTQAVLITTGFSGAALTVSGIFVGTVSFYASADGGTNWSPCFVTPSNSSTPVLTATAPGLWTANVSGYTHVSALLTALTSGSPTVSIHCSQAVASSSLGVSTGGGGGGGPALSLTTTGTTGASTYNSGTGVLNVPNYADISQIAFTTAGTTGLATYNTSTGALNIPNYMDISHIGLTNTGTTGAATYNTSTGALNIPNYADISHLTISNTGTSGPSTLTAGNLNVPVYASGVLNQAIVTTSSNVSNSTGGPFSTGFGVPFTAQFNANALVLFNCLISLSIINVTVAIQVYRTTGAIPALGAGVGTDVAIVFNRTWSPPTAGTQYTNTTATNDTTLAVGTTYNYYLTFTTSGTSTLTMYSGSVLQVTEVK